MRSYIHGGAWRDPRKTKSGIQPSLSELFPSSLSPAAARDRIAGIASLNYRLSPHPSYPAKDEDDAAARSARHPDHVNDVIDALRWLGKKWGVRDGGYVLVGHSCGGTLALQVAMSGGKKWGDSSEKKEYGEEKTPMPIAIVPVEAITDIQSLVKSHASQSMYEEFVVAAFGKETDEWKAASPVIGTYGEERWSAGRLVMLAQSREDELVEWEQCDLLLKILKEQGWEEKSSGAENRDRRASVAQEVRMLELKGQHDEIWEKGKELARAIEATVQNLVQTGCIGV